MDGGEVDDERRGMDVMTGVSCQSRRALSKSANY